MTLNGLWNKDSAENKLSDLIKKSNNILDKKSDKIISDKEYIYTDERSKCEYEPDSSSIAWKYYKIMYDKMYDKMYDEMIDEGQDIGFAGSAIRIQGLFKYTEESIKQVTYGALELGKIALAGDCVFNFKEQGVTDQSIGFDTIIEEEKDKNKQKNLENKLKCCRAMHHSPYNFSLMPVTGGMNNVKGSKYKDRIDMFLKDINDFYKCSSENLAIKMKNIIVLLDEWNCDSDNNIPFVRRGIHTDFYAYHFLATIGSFENYVEMFYHLNQNNKELIDKMLNPGKHSINNPDALNAYMDLAIEYWKIQRSKYEYITNNHKTY